MYFLFKYGIYADGPPSEVWLPSPMAKADDKMIAETKGSEVPYHSLFSLEEGQMEREMGI